MKDLEQVKEHFKYAKEVRCLDDGEIYKLSSVENIKADKNKMYCFLESQSSNWVVLYKSNQLAEILTYIFDRGEEVEVSNVVNIWYPRKFISFSLDGQPIIQNVHGNAEQFKRIRKLTPESLLEPQLSELKKTAKANGMSVEIIFKQK